MTHAVLGLYEYAGKILAVTRRDNYEDWGLPGGKLEEGETPLEALTREFKEETGLIIEQPILYTFPFFERFSDNHPEKVITVYMVKVAKGILTKEENGGLVDFIDWELLCKGSYSEYNKSLYHKFKEYKQLLQS